MKTLTRGLCLALVGAGLAAAPAAQALTSSSASNAGDPTAIQQMRKVADGAVAVSVAPSTGKVSFIRTNGADADLLPGVAATTGAAAAAKADAYLKTYSAAFGAAKGELTRDKTTTTPYGWTVSYSQKYQGIPVFGSGIKANVDTAGDLTAVTGYAAPGIDLSVSPRLGAGEAGRRAVKLVKSDPAKEDGKVVSTAGIEPTKTSLVIYRLGFLKDEVGENRLAYYTEVTNGANIRDAVVTDAQTGKPLNRWSMTDGALDRELREATANDGGTPTDPADDTVDFETVYTEGDDISQLNTDQQNLVNSSGESYYLYLNAFGRDSYDGLGAKRITVNNDPRIDCPNANWNGTTTNYCDGVTSDDVVAHEWGHAYTEYTSGLIYQYQSGALNESYSDVWGETVDQVNGREDEGEIFGTKRPDNECDPTAAPKLLVSITAPASVAGPCTAAAAGFGPAFTTTAVTPNVVVATDESNTAGTSTTDGCTAYTNAAAVLGSYAYVDRGTCTFQVKADMAKAAGATGIVVGDNAPARLPISMSGTSTLPGIMVTQADGTRIKSVGTVTMAIQAEDISARTDSTRWLVGEKSDAFGGAIRDMWTPTCYNNPGKVSDAEYTCDVNNTDNGGVHGNSGVPNHAYALAVDGGTFNGQTITGIGLDQAAAIWWRNQTAYLTPSSNFSDAADGFEQSCADLVGKPLTKLSTAANPTPVAATPITAANCADLAKVMLAVQMRAPVTQCNFQPLLAKNTPSLCGAGFATDAFYTEDFEDGLAGWTPTLALGDGGNKNAPWQSSSKTFTDHTSKTAFGPDPDKLGTCDPNNDDSSSRDSITSPSIAVPTGTLRNLSMSFEHYIATEIGYDGGNIKISRNGQAFTTIPTTAYTFNKPKTLTTAATNTSPLAGQPGFTGTDGGQSRGSWGTSQIDLAAAGVVPGDSVRIRIDMGRDGCGGVDGWYIDNITMTVCEVATTITATHTPEPVLLGQPSSINATVAAADATVPTGSVTVKEGATTLGTAPLSAGTATFALPTTLSPGVHNLVVTYPGDATYAPVSTPVVVTVTLPDAHAHADAHADADAHGHSDADAHRDGNADADADDHPPVVKVNPTVKVNAPGSVEKGDKIKVKVKVSATGPTPTGLVTIYYKGDVVGTGILSGGKVTIKVKTNDLKVGKRAFTVTYGGSTTVNAASTTFKVKIKR